MGPVKVLVVGSGAREHAIAAALARSPREKQLFCMGTANNPGISKLTEGYVVSNICDPVAAVALAKQWGVELAVVGPEAPLAAGVSDALRAAGVACVGPSAALAQIESSKNFALEVLSRHGVAGVPAFRAFTSLEGAREYLEELGEGHYVVKADGLCGGKGVKVAGDHLHSIDEAVAYCKELLPSFMICEKLQGQEFSVLSFCDGETLAHMPVVQDHKRAHEGDTGPNTGGMGAYSCADHLLPFLSAANVAEAQAINGACVRVLRAELGELYRGVLYGGFMLTTRGVMLIEFNARLGDPECLNLLSLLAPSTDFLAVCEGMARGGLRRVAVDFQRKASCCKYAVPEGYPDKPLKGGAIDLSGLQHPEGVYLGAVDEATGGGLVATGSRTVGVVALADELDEAQAMAEAEVCAVKGKLFHRADVGTPELVAQRVAHMLSLRKQASGGRAVRIGVLGSTRGSSLQPVLRAICAGELEASVELVLSNKKEAGILQRAAHVGVPAKWVPVSGKGREEYDAALTAELEAAQVDVVLLVGFMRILSPCFCERWKRRALNVHPSLLPAFAGGMDLQVHSAVLEAGVAESGCTVHLVEALVDAGAVVEQRRCAVLAADTPHSLKARVQALEGPALCAAIATLGTEVAAAKAKRAAAAPSAGGAISYRDAGVDIAAGNALVESIKPLAKGTSRSGVIGKIGGFGGLFDAAAAGYTDPILVSATDGVGTKLMIAQETGRHGTIGIDLVAMVVNDLIVQGAEPLFFLDYFATGKLENEQAVAVLKGIAKGCGDSDCALLGGETAEMPGMYGPGHYDLAGFAVGAVGKADLLPKLETLVAGDVLLGLPSSGVHSNGFSLVRKVVERVGVGWNEPCPFAPGVELADALLVPTKLYVRGCLPLCRSGKLKALAHITGGGLLENIPRVLPPHLAAHLHGGSWSPPAVFGWLAAGSKSSLDNMLRTFNCGIGMVLIVAQQDVDAVSAQLRASGEEFSRIGEICDLAAGAEQVVVDGTESWGWAC